MKCKGIILIFFMQLFFTIGCQNITYTEMEYFEDGAIKKEIKSITNGAINWSDKEINAFKIGG
ncbi:hypothetical protein AAEX28_03405 [Lentisphaerota bacterium WC36G]|nr:hypothetical protein LJT99_06280 [Lentisphaerae bacterium WC36]